MHAEDDARAPLPRRAQAWAFGAFLASQFLSRLADQMLLFLVPLVVYQSTDSVAWSGWAFAAESLPRFLSFPLCGALCDRVSPLRLLRLSQLLRGGVCLLSAWASAQGGGLVWLVGMSAVCGVLTTQGMMAREVILPQAFGERAFARVLAHVQLADQAGAVLGPAVAALCLAAWPWPTVVLLSAGGFLLADAAAWSWWRLGKVGLRAPQSASGWRADARIAFAHLAHLPGLLRLTWLTAGLNLMLGVTLASSAAFFTGLHGQTSAAYAVLQTAGAVATVLVLLWVAQVVMPLRRMGWAAYALVLCGGLLTAWASTPLAYAAGYLMIIGFDKMFSIAIRVRRQQLIPPGDYGKTTGVIVMLNNLSQPLAGLAVGSLSGWLGPAQLIVLVALVMGAAGAYAASGRSAILPA